MAIMHVPQWREGNARDKGEEDCHIKKIGCANELGVDLKQMGFPSTGFY